MIVNVYSVFDSKMATFGMPKYDVSDGSAIRNFSDGVNRAEEGNTWNKHPEDFQLFKLGTFDDVTGLFESHPPVAVITAAAVSTVIPVPKKK